MIENIIKEEDHYLVFYMNGDPKGKKKYWNDLSVSEKLEIADFYKEQAGLPKTEERYVIKLSNEQG